MGPVGYSEVAEVISLHEFSRALTERGAEEQGRRLRPALLGDAPRSASAMHALERARAAWAKTQPQLQLFQSDVGGRTRGGDIPPSAPLATARRGRPAPGPRP
jgi:hypothetical protein